MLYYKCNKCGYDGSLNESVPGFLVFLCLIFPILLLPFVIYICYSLEYTSKGCKQCKSIDVECTNLDTLQANNNILYITVIPYILFVIYLLYSQFITPIESDRTTTDNSYVASTPVAIKSSKDDVIESVQERFLIELPPPREISAAPPREIIESPPTKDKLISSCQGRGLRYYAIHDQNIPFKIINKKIVLTCAKDYNAFK